jgi:hypothetical protein
MSIRRMSWTPWRQWQERAGLYDINDKEELDSMMLMTRMSFTPRFQWQGGAWLHHVNDKEDLAYDIMTRRGWTPRCNDKKELDSMMSMTDSTMSMTRRSLTMMSWQGGVGLRAVMIMKNWTPPCQWRGGVGRWYHDKEELDSRLSMTRRSWTTRCKKYPS